MKHFELLLGKEPENQIRDYVIILFSFSIRWSHVHYKLMTSQNRLLKQLEAYNMIT